MRVRQAISTELDQACRSGSSSLSAGSARRDSTVGLLGQACQYARSSLSAGSARRDSTVGLPGQACQYARSSLSAGSARRDSTVGLLGQACQYARSSLSAGTAKRDSTVRLLNWASPGVSVRQEFTFSRLPKAWQYAYSLEVTQQVVTSVLQSHKVHLEELVLHFNLTSSPMDADCRYSSLLISQGSPRHAGTPFQPHKAHQGIAGTPVQSHKAHQCMWVLQFNLIRLIKAFQYSI